MPLIATSVIRAIGLFDFSYFLLVGIGYGLIAFMLARRLPDHLVAKLFALYILLPFASVLDASVDSMLYQHGRNLWGLEVILLLVVVPLPLLLGALIGRYFGRCRNKGDVK